MESGGMGGIATLGHAVEISRSTSPFDRKYHDSVAVGPYFAHYWSIVQNGVDSDGIPYAINGGYISPYGTAPEAFLPAIQNPEMPVPDDVASWEMPSGCHESLFTHSRSFHPVQENGIPYSVDPQGWGQYNQPDPLLQLQNLPILNSVANQILTKFMSGTVQDFVATVTSPDTGQGQAYATLGALFDQTKRMFSREHLFINVNSLGFNSSAFARTVRKVNLATFVACIFRGHDIPFLELDEAFLDIFMPSGSRLLKQEAALYLELKTQAFISAMLGGGVSKDEVLHRLFPRDLQLAILRRRPEPSHLAPSEQDFISRVNTRRQYLSTGADDGGTLAQLPQRYKWKDFLDELCLCVQRALENIDTNKDSRNFTTILTTSSSLEDPITKATLAAHAAISDHNRTMARTVSCGTTSSIAASTNVFSCDSPTSDCGQPLGKIGSSARSVASASPTTPTTPLSHSGSRFPASNPTSHPSGPSQSGSKGPGSGGLRRPHAPSPRRPWTPEEETALMDGLDRVRGPHWSQILALYGAGGSISEVLKDRNQVQLKDKARNLKLYFLKSGLDVPGYLKRVTGELRTRAPGQAARRERERRREEEKRAQEGDEGL